MHKLKYVILTILNLAAISLKAQIAIGIQGGYDSNILDMNIKNLAFTKNGKKTGVDFDAAVDIKLTDYITFKTGITYLKKNHALVRTAQYTGLYEEFKNSYLQVPLLMSYSLGKNGLKVFGNAGIYGSYWLNGDVNGLVPNIFNVTDSVGNNGTLKESFGVSHYQQSYRFDSSKDKRFEFGFAFGLGTDFLLNKNNFLRLQGNFYSSITSQQKNYTLMPNNRFNNTLAVTAGIIHNLSPAKTK